MAEQELNTWMQDYITDISKNTLNADFFSDIVCFSPENFFTDYPKVVEWLLGLGVKAREYYQAVLTPILKFKYYDLSSLF